MTRVCVPASIDFFRFLQTCYTRLYIVLKPTLPGRCFVKGPGCPSGRTLCHEAG